jgi:amino acid permease
LGLVLDGSISSGTTNETTVNFSKMLDVPNKLVAASTYMAFWTSAVHPAAWITIYLIPPVLFNLFNVRRYGEIEFWLTLQKVITFVLLISYGILMAMQASDITPWSGTTSTYEPLPCSESDPDIPCVGGPGFNRRAKH